MFQERLPTPDSPGLQYSGVVAKHNALIPHALLARAAEDLRLTTPTIHTALKFAFRQELTNEEQGILASFSLKRGPRDFLVTPMLNGAFDEDSGLLSTIDGLRLAGFLDLLPTKPEDALQPDDIMICGFLRWQPISVLWDLADGINKGHPFGAPKPWVVDELQVLGLVLVGEPVSDGTRGRPPKQLIITSWGRRFVELTRRRAGFEITDAYRRAARVKSSGARPRLNGTDKLVAGFLANRQPVPDRILKRMSDYGKQELSRAYGVEL